MFLEKEEINLNKEFMKKGYIVRPVSNLVELDKIQKLFVKEIGKKFKSEKNNLLSLNNFHKKINVNDLNNFRVHMINHINSDLDFRKKYFLLAKKYLYTIAGNELVMQNKVNLSIQLPNDDSSLLPIHSDTWSGDSPFEVVVWLPLVDCHSTKSMYILPPKHMRDVKKFFDKNKNANSDEIFNKIKKKVDWIKIKYGEFLLFNQNLPHGNVINKINETRWSMNCRFKSLFSPYGDKKIGEFFEPITLRSASEIGMNYKYPNETST
jgi:sporadic carbohydrate cluster 2OG-Fe(II) oxygenase